MTQQDSGQTSYTVIRKTWLSRTPKAESGVVAAGATLFLGIMSLVYLIPIEPIATIMPASGLAVFEHGEIWRLWSTLFAHADLGHFVSNSFLFFILGYFLYGYFGWRLFPLSALFWGGIANYLVLRTYDPQSVLIGASGVVYWMGGAWLVLYFFLSRQKNLMQRWLRTLGVGVLIFMPAETFEPSVSYRTHFVGFLLGLMAGGWHYFAHRAEFRSAEVHERIYEPTDSVPQDVEQPGAKGQVLPHQPT